MYFIHKTINGDSLILTEDNGPIVHIPFDEANAEYQRYLAWVAEGNTAEVVES